MDSPNDRSRPIGSGDSPSDPSRLAEFYRQLLNLEVIFSSEEFVALKGAGGLLTMQRVEGYFPPEWPSGLIPKQLHLELAVEELGAAEETAQSLGATEADAQPSPDRGRVLMDLAGHPFCITTLIPEV